MSYVALYRKFRPREFEDVKGQEHIVKTLNNQIMADRIGHAYLFCGTRGTGKTTVAKIFARAVNCEHPIDGSPCNECPTCKSILNGTSMNVIEIDAASNNGVDNIRDIKNEIAYSPTDGRYKVYIIDEVHMLSMGAFNALLKTLEEPPEYVIFILATTEAHKIPITILSRCQRYDFKRITIETIAKRLRELADKENVDVEEKALSYIAKKADGSMRDALSLFDQCIAFYLGEKLNFDNVLEVLGAVDTEVFGKMLDEILKNDISGILRDIEDIIMEGRDLSQFTLDYTWYLRNLLLIQSSDNMEDVIDVSTQNLEVLKNKASRLDFNTLIRFIRIFSELSNKIKYASQKRVLLETTLIKLCRPQMDNDIEALIQRITELEDKVSKGIVVNDDSFHDTAKTVSENTKLLHKAVPEEIKSVIQNWHSIVMDIPGLTQQYLNRARLSLSQDDKLMIVVEDAVGEGIINKPERIGEIEAVIEKKTGCHVDIEVKGNTAGNKFENSFIDIEKLINMEITIEDD